MGPKASDTLPNGFQDTLFPGGLKTHGPGKYADEVVEKTREWQCTLE